MAAHQILSLPNLPPSGKNPQLLLNICHTPIDPPIFVEHSLPPNPNQPRGLIFFLFLIVLEGLDPKPKVRVALYKESGVLEEVIKKRRPIKRR